MDRRKFIKTLAASVLATSPCFIALTARASAAMPAATSAEAFPLANFGGSLVTASSPDYSQHKGVFNLDVVSEPSLVSFCADAADIGTTLGWAAKKGESEGIRLRSGGHSYEGFSVGTDVVVIDVSRLNEIEVDPQGFVSVGSGVKLGDLVTKLAASGFALPTGSCPSVGVSGLTLGGGHGMLSRMYGLTCDSLVEVEMTLASGKQITASEGQNADLFWACQGGGGGNFGVATRFKFKIYPIKSVVRYRVRWAPIHAEGVLASWQAWLASQPSDISSTLDVNVLDGAVDGIHMNGLHTGDLEVCNKALDPLCKLFPATEREAVVSDYLSAARYFWGGRPAPVHFKATSDYGYEPMTAESAHALLSHGQAQTTAGGAVALLFDGYGGAIAAKAPADSAFFHRKAVFCLQYYSEWNSASASAERIAMVLGLRKAMDSFFQPRRAYVNYCDLSIVDWRSAYYGDNYARLAQIKSKYDPANQISHAQGIEPKA